MTLPQREYEQHAADNDGYCLACGEEQSGGCEPDAEGYPCEACGEPQVIAFEHALVAGYITSSEDPRERGDDDDVEYGDPGDELDRRLRED
jgi:hypothetical protein